MGERLVLKTNEKPSYFNKDTALGALLGTTFLPIPIIGTIAGAVVGGRIGKRRMEDDLLNGKVVEKGSFWNKDTAIGSMLGMIGSVLVAGAGLVAASFFMDPLTAIAAVNPVLATAAIGGSMLGGFLGGMSGKAEADKEFEQAKIQQGIEQQISRGQALSMVKALEQDPQMAQENTRGFAAQIEHERAAQALAEHKR